jgi:hypothetical protein
MSDRIDNKQLVRVRKDVITAAEALKNAGARNPTVWRNFIYNTMDLTSLLPHVEVLFDDGPSFKVHRIEPGKRLGMAAAEATANLGRSGIKHSTMTVTPHEAIIGLEVTKNYLRYNQEGPEAAKTIISDLFMPTLANEVEESILLSDKRGMPIKESDRRSDGSTTKYVKDSMLSMEDGLITLAENGAVRVDGKYAALSTLQLKQARTALDIKYRKIRNKLRYLNSLESEDNLRYKLSNRVGPEADKQISGEDAIKILGAPVVGMPLLPHRIPRVKHVTLTGTTPVALDYKHCTDVLVFKDLDMSPEAAVSPYSDTTDYIVTIDADGTTKVAARAGSTIGSGDEVKVFYKAPPQVLHTFQGNIVLVFHPRGFDIDYDKDIFARNWQCAITATYGWGIKFPDGVVQLYDLNDNV